jgi:hypothetical protein
VDQCKRGEKLRHQDGAGVLVGHPQPAGVRPVQQGEALHRVHLPDVVGLLGPRAVFLAGAAGARRGQPGLPQPELQGAGGRDELLGVVLEQVDADARRPPARVGAAEGATGLLHGQAAGVQRPPAAVELGGEVRARRFLPPLREQAPDSACGEGHGLGNLWRTEALLMKVEDALARFRRGGGRHEGGLLGDKRRAARRREQAGGQKEGRTGAKGGIEGTGGWCGRPCLVASRPCREDVAGARFYLPHPRAANLSCAGRRLTFPAHDTPWPAGPPL